MTVAYTPGALTKVSINNTAMAVLSCTLGKKEVLLQRAGIRGTRSHFDTDVRKGPQHIAGAIRMEPSYAELVSLMALAIGSGGNAADSLSDFTVVVDRHTQADSYAGCKVSKATISGTQGGIISCDLELIGKTETTNSGTVSTPNSGVPFIFSDIALNLANTVREAHSFTLTIDNHIDAERFLNSTTLSQVVEMDRTVTLSTVHPFSSDNLDLYNQGVGGAAGTLALNNTTNTATFSFGKLQVPAERPEIPGKSEVTLTLNMIATKVSGSSAGTTDEIAFA